MTSVRLQSCFELAKSLDDSSVDLLLTDPPYSGVLGADWDNQWTNAEAYAAWFCSVLEAFLPKLRPSASAIFFGGIGKHGDRPLFRTMLAIEARDLLYHRNLITWKKLRAYGKSHDYLFCREELAWYSVSKERTQVTFNIPLLAEKRGYEGFSKKYPAKSEYKRVSNVWTDIPELMRPTRSAEKPVALMARLVETHSNKGDLIVDPFAGTGATGVAALSLGRRFVGCDTDQDAVSIASERCRIALQKAQPGWTNK